MPIPLIIFIVGIVALALVVWVIQYFSRRKIRRSVKLILKWYNHILQQQPDFDMAEIRRLGDEAHRYIEKNELGKKTIYFAPRLKEYIVNRFGKREGENVEKAFRRLAQWEADQVRYDAYWTMLRGNFAQYAEKLEAGGEADFTVISAPLAIILRYWNYTGDRELKKDVASEGQFG